MEIFDQYDEIDYTGKCDPTVSQDSFGVLLLQEGCAKAPRHNQAPSFTNG
jgi:hypothetical protein